MILRDAFADLGRNWLRSGLTLFGILWGIASFVVLSGLGRGFQSNQQNRVQEFGVDMRELRPGAPGNQDSGRRGGEAIRLAEADTAILRANARLVKRVSPELINWGINYQLGPRSFSGEVHGVMPEYGAIRNMVLKRGRFVSQADVDE